MYTSVGGAASGVLLALLLPACGVETSLDSPDSSARLRAIQQASASQDQAAIPKLICLLESDDPAVRLLSIRTLERMTGQTFGFDHAAPESDRQDAVRKWQSWYSDRRDAGARKGPAADAAPKPVSPGSAGAPRSDLSSPVASQVDHP